MEEISFTLNGKPVTVTTDGERMLLWVLRTDLGLTGTKFGCGEGYCGACTVIVGGAAVRSCQFPVSRVKGQEVVTIEGLGGNGKLHPLQQAFMDHDALQCGYCTPGMILTTYSLLREKPAPARQEIIDAMENNLCRCGSHTRIIDAIEDAAKQMKGAGK
jgi:aerobic-type carbon monoxide dehydrogenase small subunit (CoxS/CutS family)